MLFKNIGIILWLVTLTTSSFSLRTWRTVNGMDVLFSTSLWKFDSMPSWKNENFIESKWNYEFTSFLERAFAWIHARFKPLKIGLSHILFMMFGVFLDLLTSINVSLHII
jgi:hypothetical protein